MALEERDRGPSTPGGIYVVMLVCPLCGHEFTAHESRPQHFRLEHSPDDLAGPSGGEPA